MNNIKEILLDKHVSFLIFQVFWQHPRIQAMMQVYGNIFLNS